MQPFLTSPTTNYLWIQGLGPCFQDFDCHLEAEHELVPLKQAQAGVAVHITRKGVDDGSQAALQINLALAVGEGLQHSAIMGR